MTQPAFDVLTAQIGALPVRRQVGRIAAISGGTVTVSGLPEGVVLGDRVSVSARDGTTRRGEVAAATTTGIEVLTEGGALGLGLGDQVTHQGPPLIAPHTGWIGRVVDAYGAPLDGRPLTRGLYPLPLRADPPPATTRRALGGRLSTGLAVFNTMLPLVRGQRIGLFAGSGVGKSTLLAQLARGLSADVAVVALIGERGREVREFTETTLGTDGMARSVVVAATSDRSALERRQAALTAMTVAEYFRDQGRHVLLLVDSLTRFAEAHREIALNAGEQASFGGFPHSMPQAIMSLAERAGPGAGMSGDITAVFSVLVAGSDMDEPVADTVRGVLDGHVVLDRAIAERGRFPAVELLRSVSRSLPRAASEDENRLITRARHLLGTYQRAELMIQSGLYSGGTDPEIDAAIAAWPVLDAFLAEPEPAGPAESFARLSEYLSQVESLTAQKA